MPKTASRPGTDDATHALERDHREVEQLFERVHDAKGPDARWKAYERLRDALALHGLLEEAIFYPAVAGLPGMPPKDLVVEAVHEHMDVKTCLADLEATPPDSPAFLAKVGELEGRVSHHVEEEESEMFPRARKLLGADRLRALGARMAEARAARERARRPAEEARRTK
jgi:hemerythrin superfamily protein